MDVFELYDLANLYRIYYKRLSSLYNSLHSILSQNASQPTQQPVEEHLNNLVDFLKTMDISKLSLQQLKILEHLQVENILGPLGADSISETVKTASYDPASTEKKVQAIIQKLSTASQKLNEYYNSIASLEIESESFDDISDRIIVRVGFKNDASIENVVDWKISSENWHHIIRGVALISGEAPENTKVVGASKGSIILILATTVAVAKILAMIAKYAKSIAMDVIEIQNALEDLRKKKLSTKIIETELNKKMTASKEKGVTALKSDLAKLIPANASGDAQNALDKSIDKLLEFGENGGDLDFVAPPDEETVETEDDDAEQDHGTAAELQEARKFIQEYQTAREEMRLLEHRSNN